MPSEREQFFALPSLAVVGNSDLGPFPGEVYAELRDGGSNVFPVDLGGSRYVQGDEAFPSLHDLPETVAGVIVALPRHKVLPLVQEMAQLQIKSLWIEGGDAPEVVQLCEQHQIRIFLGNARSYTRPGFSLGRWLLKLVGKY